MVDIGDYGNKRKYTVKEQTITASCSSSVSMVYDSRIPACITTKKEVSYTVIRTKRAENSSKQQSIPTTISNNREMRINHESPRETSTKITNPDHPSDNENLQNENPKNYVTTSQKIKSSSLHKNSCSCSPSSSTSFPSSSTGSPSYLSSSFFSSISNSFQKFTPVKLIIGALLLTNTRNSRFSPVLLAESSILSNTLHHLTLKYEHNQVEYNIGKDDLVIAYGRNSRDSKIKSTSSNSNCLGMPYSEMERQLGIRDRMIYSVLKKYKSLINKLTKTEPYKTFYTYVQPDWKGNLDQVRNVLRKSTKTRCISSEMLDSLEEAISNFYQLSNGRAFAGFEYPMNGLIAPVEPLIEQRFKKTIENDPIKRGQFMFYMNMKDTGVSSIRRSPFVAYNEQLLDTIKQMRNIVKQYQIYESSKEAKENLNAARAYAEKPLIRREKRAVFGLSTGLETGLDVGKGRKRDNDKKRGRKGKKGDKKRKKKNRTGDKKGGRKNRKLENMKADVNRDEILTGEIMTLQSSENLRGKRSALPLNKILRASRKALTGASEYYDKIQGPIIFYIKAAVMEDWQIPDDSKK